MSRDLFRTSAVTALLISMAAPPILGGRDLSAQEDRGNPYRIVGQRDSVELLETAQSAQARFERLRTSKLPWTLPRGRRCDETVGRFCFWHDEDEDDWTPPAEDLELVAGRDSLISLLDSAAQERPGDNWIVGQRVRYLLEAMRRSDAERAAEECRATDWWCAALMGLVQHSTGNYLRAQEAFWAALAKMPGGLRCEWKDPRLLIDRDTRHDFDDLDCQALERLADRLWWLADPLLLTPGNERLTEHYSRLVLVRILESARNPYGIGWGRDLEELLLRYGWPDGWERSVASAASIGAGTVIVGRNRSQGSYFMPPRSALYSPSLILPEDWSLFREMPRTAYRPTYAAGYFYQLDHQLAKFLRGDSVLLVAAYGLSSDSTPIPSRVQAGLWVFRHPDQDPLLAYRDEAEVEDIVELLVPPDTAFVSIELLSEEEGIAARSRYGVSLAPRERGRVSLSDLMLLEPSNTLPTDLEGAKEIVLTSTSLSEEREIGVFWEIYGLLPGKNPVSVRLELAKAKKGWLRRAAEQMRLRDKEAPVSLSWEETIEVTSNVAARSVNVELPDLDPGVYLLTLELRAEGRRPALTYRPIRVLPD